MTKNTTTTTTTTTTMTATTGLTTTKTTTQTSTDTILHECDGSGVALLSPEEAAQFKKLSQLTIKQSNFQNLCREVLQSLKPDFDLEGSAFALLQDSAEQLIQNIFKESDMIAFATKHLEVSPHSMSLGKRNYNTCI